MDIVDDNGVVTEYPEDDASPAQPANRPPPGMPINIAYSLIQAMAEVEAINHDAENKFGHYTYASIDAFLTYTGRLLAKHGLGIVMNEVAPPGYREGRNDKGQPAWVMSLAWDIWIFDKAGQMFGPLRRHVNVQGMGAQAFGAAQSYILKMFLRGLLQIPTGEPDADADQPVSIPEQLRPQQRQSSPPPADHPSSQPTTSLRAPYQNPEARQIYDVLLRDLATVKSAEDLERYESYYAEQLAKLKAMNKLAHDQVIKKIGLARNAIMEG